MMSVYNGRRFVLDQISSILNQHNVQVSLIIRDDGSTDNTVDLIYSQHRGRVRLIRGSNLGAAASFLELTFSCADETADYFAYSDADDVWLPDKLSAAISRMPDTSSPVLYASRLMMVDADLKPLGLSPPPRIKPCFEHAMVQSAFGGATAVMTSCLFKILVSARPQKVHMHDAWLYLIGSAFGSVVFDDVSYILYRQHGGNAVGGKQSATKRWRRRLDEWLRSCDDYRDQAKELQRLFPGNLPDDKQRLLDRYLGYDQSFWSRLSFVLAPSVRHNTLRSRLFYSARVLAART